MKILILLSIFFISDSFQVEIETVFEWKKLDFEWLTDNHREDLIKSGEFIEKNNVPNGISKWNNKMFIAVSRWSAGTPSTLNYVLLNSTEKSPALIPYPTWRRNVLPKKGRKARRGHDISKNETKITSVFRTKVDVCDRLWVVDQGVDDFNGATRKQVQKPQILIYDLKTDKLIRRYEMKDTDWYPESTFANLAIDVEPDQCDKAFAYIPDLGSSGMVVYNLKKNDSWRIKHHYFHFDPLQGNYLVNGIEYQWNDGLFGASLGPIESDGFKTLYFHPFSSTNEFAVSTKILRNKDLVPEISNTHSKTFHEFKFIGKKGEKTQSSISAIDHERDVMFFTQVQKNGIACWNIKKPMTPENFYLVVENLNYPNDLIVDDGYLWILNNNMPQFFYASLDLENVNFNVVKVKIDDAIKGTPCAE